MELNMKPKWILDENNPEGVRECEVMKVEPEILNLGIDSLMCVKYELIDKTTPFLQTIKCVNMERLQDNGLVWVKEAFDTKEEALTALEVKRRENWEKEG